MLALLVLLAASPAAAADLSGPHPTNVPVEIRTVPDGLDVSFDGVIVPTPYSFSCGNGTSHTVTAPSPQFVGGTRFTFIEWSDGTPSPTRTFVCDAPQNMTALFLIEDAIDFATVPTGLVLLVNGTGNAAPFRIWCTRGARLDVSAPSPQFSGGGQATFANWSDGGPQNRQTPCNGPASYVAMFVREFFVAVFTSPDRLLVVVDGVIQSTPAFVLCREGSLHTILPVERQTSGGQEYVFSGWLDGGPANRTIVCERSTNLTAIFQLVSSPPPPGGAPPFALGIVALVIVLGATVPILVVVLTRRADRRAPVARTAVPTAPSATDRTCPTCGRGAALDWTWCPSCGGDLRGAR